MFSSEHIERLAKEAIARLSSQTEQNHACKKESNGGSKKSAGFNLMPSEALVIAGILGGVLKVDSILIDREQTVQIVLEGSLKQKTRMEKMMDEIGSMPFDDVMKLYLDRLT